MNKSLTAILGLVAGLAGGLLARYIAPPAVLAQNQAPVTNEIRAQRFTLVDQMDRTVGMFMVEGDVSSFQMPDDVVPAPDRKRLPAQMEPRQAVRPRRILLVDPNGRELWSAGGSLVRPLSANSR